MDEYLEKMKYYESLKKKEQEQNRQQQEQQRKEAQKSRVFIPEDEDDKRLAEQLEQINDQDNLHTVDKRIESQQQKYQNIRKNIIQQINTQYKSEYDRSKYQKYNSYQKQKQQESEAFTWEQVNPESVKQFISQRLQRGTFFKYVLLGTIVYQFGKHLPYSYVYIQQFRDKRRYKKLLKSRLQQTQ